MNIRMGSQTFVNVQIPLLWGKRAVIQDENGSITIINLGGDEAKIEILFDEPAEDVEYTPRDSGYEIISGHKTLYFYDPEDKILRGIELNLPECQFGEQVLKVGGSTFSGNMVVGSAIGISVTERGIGMGASMPPNLAKLIV